MVSVAQDVPRWVREADVDTYLELADPPVRIRQRLREADRDAQIRLLARGWFATFHGSRNESKRRFAIFMNEEGIPFTGEDIQAITDEPPVNTQT